MTSLVFMWFPTELDAKQTRRGATNLIRGVIAD
jgi:hypothetical protein